MAEGQHAGEAPAKPAISAAPCGSAPTRRGWPADSKIADIYGDTEISERHRHRYEVNIDYKERLEDCGLVFAGMSPDGVLPETVEYPDHPWFIGVQYHPELKSRPFDPHPLFASFIGAADGAEPAGLMLSPVAARLTFVPAKISAARSTASSHVFNPDDPSGSTAVKSGSLKA